VNKNAYLDTIRHAIGRFLIKVELTWIGLGTIPE
jgi:hypothetical protein